jgi:hypothetical protein
MVEGFKASRHKQSNCRAAKVVPIASGAPQAMSSPPSVVSYRKIAKVVPVASGAPQVMSSPPLVVIVVISETVTVMLHTRRACSQQPGEDGIDDHCRQNGLRGVAVDLVSQHLM